MYITNVEEYLSVHAKQQIGNKLVDITETTEDTPCPTCRVDKYYGNRYDKAGRKAHCVNAVGVHCKFNRCAV